MGGSAPPPLNCWLLKDSEVKSRGSLSSNVYSLESPPGPIGLFHTGITRVITQMPWGQLSGSQNETKSHEHRKGTSKGGAGRYWREVIESGG